jgi:hypothetical protein
MMTLKSYYSFHRNLVSKLMIITKACFQKTTQLIKENQSQSVQNNQNKCLIYQK